MTGSIKDYTPNYKFILPRFDLATWHDYIEQNFRSIDALFYNLFVVNQYKGMWEHSTIYNVGDVVFIGEDNNSTSEGKLYKVLVQHTTPATGTFTDYKTENPTYYALYVESTIQIDTQLDTTSDRPVQNSAIATAVNLKANISDLANVAFTGKYIDLLNKPNLATVATSGSYDDLLDKPNYALDNEVVHKTSVETITGDKTFSGNVKLTKYTGNPQSGLFISNDYPNYAISIQHTDCTKGTAPNKAKYAGIDFYGTKADDYNDRLGFLEFEYLADKTTGVKIGAYKANSSSDNVASSINIKYPPSGNPYATAPASDVGGSIVTTISKTKANNGGFKLGNGEITQKGKAKFTANTLIITFPIPFSNTNYSFVAIATDNRNSGYSYDAINGVTSRTATSITIYSYYGNQNIDWIAIGY